jgi:hypothetical protein
MAIEPLGEETSVAGRTREGEETRTAHKQALRRVMQLASSAPALEARLRRMSHLLAQR